MLMNFQYKFYCLFPLQQDLRDRDPIYIRLNQTTIFNATHTQQWHSTTQSTLFYKSMYHAGTQRLVVSIFKLCRKQLKHYLFLQYRCIGKNYVYVCIYSLQCLLIRNTQFVDFLCCFLIQLEIKCHLPPANILISSCFQMLLSNIK